MKNRLVPVYLTPIQQYLRFAERGMHFDQARRHEDIRKLQEIGYYKLKEYAYAMSEYDQYGNLTYHETRFDNVVNKYYRDKRLQMEVFSGILDIEPFLASSIVSVLGRRYGAYGYWQCRTWASHGISKEVLLRYQDRFQRAVIRGATASRLDDLSEISFSLAGPYPSIWLLGDYATFGMLVAMLRMMSAANLRRIANYFNCSPTELISRMQTINFIRNQCAHNHNLIDIKLKTRPNLPVEYTKYLVQVEDRISDRVATCLYLLKVLLCAVNPQYDFAPINDAVDEFFQDENFSAQRLGVNNKTDLRL